MLNTLQIINFKGAMKKENKGKIKETIKKVVLFILNPRLLLCFGIAWIITNGWAYITLAVATHFKIGWLIALSGGYLALMWVPGTPEKIVTVAISIFLLRLLFPKDEKTLGILKGWRVKFVSAIKSVKKKKNDNTDDSKKQ